MSGVGVELLGVIAVGIGAAAVLYAALHAARKAGLVLPRWILAAGIGLAMIGYSVWNDYSWFERAKGRLPADTEILLTGTDKMPWAPWTYLFPITTRFAALDPASIERSGADAASAQITLVERRGPMLVVGQDFDCVGGRIRPGSADWMSVTEGDPAFAYICGEEG
ncbi:hypothetical protein [Paracoccus tegillarcae]|uniref:Uncharacterized protein n=1 Tax=Paracoccus tegillarcae TaxID=1529068 RepID=A0A2K9EL47_9RHOB|nr:hypothetical protein [Paracoccus tegillarcae]AUH34147.1 hypothetical protein CUV01_12745 [Paracoccus tegillarcae]